jgi:hypothetical protein
MMDPRYRPRPPEPEYRRGRGRPRSTTSQTVPAIVLVLVLIVSVIGITRYIAGRTVAQQRERASVTVTTAPDAGQGPATTTTAGQAPTTTAGRAPTTTAGRAPTTTAGQAPTTTAGGAAGGQSPIAPDGTGANGNLIQNAGFEDGLALQGWKATGAQAQRVQPGWESDRAVLVRPAAGAGGSVLGIQATLDRGRTGGAVSATAWVRAVKAGTSARIAVLERVGAKTVAGDVVTLPLYDTQWHIVQVKHALRGSGTVSLAVGLAPGQDGASLLVDAVAARPAEG